jgi:hypothetical protein
MTEKQFFFVTTVAGTVIAIIAWSALPADFPKMAVAPILWMIISMSFFWGLDRIIHAVGGIPGETERDGVLWLIPLSLGWIPVAIFELKPDLGKYYLFLSIIIYSVCSYFFITLSRPEINVEYFYKEYHEASGWNSFKDFFGMIRYKMKVSTKKTFNLVSVITKEEPETKGLRALSKSYGFFTFFFSLVAFFTSTSQKIAFDSPPVVFFGAALGGGLWALAGQTMAAKDQDTRWEMSPEEKKILCTLYLLAAIDIVIFVIFITLLYEKP